MNIGNSVQLDFVIRYNPAGFVESSDIIWEKQSNEINGFKTLIHRGSSYTIQHAREGDAGVYYAYWDDNRENMFLGILIRLIVRGTHNTLKSLTYIFCILFECVRAHNCKIEKKILLYMPLV